MGSIKDKSIPENKKQESVFSKLFVRIISFVFSRKLKTRGKALEKAVDHRQ